MNRRSARPPTVLTFTANLLAETTLSFESIRLGKTQRATDASFQVGGKGINVVRMLQRTGRPGLALCFTGGPAGDQCKEWLSDAGIPFRAFPSRHPTRPGLVVRAPDMPETTFLGLDNPPDPDAIARAAAFLATPANRRRPLAISGSIPGWTDPAWQPFRSFLAARPRGSFLAVDTYGPPLEWFVSQRVNIVKINRREFDLLRPGREPIQRRLARAAAELEPRLWVVTDGPRPVWYAVRGDRPRRHCPPPTEEVSPTGSGDVFLAGLIEGLIHRQLALDAAIALAARWAAANAASPGIADFEMK